MSPNIPDDVMRAAAELIEALGSWESPVIKRRLVESYLLAERTRCAGIVKTYRIIRGEPGMMTVRPATLTEIEAAILNPPSAASSRAELTGEAQSLPASPVTHSSDCAVHNEPALPNGPCDCGANLTHEEAQ